MALKISSKIYVIEILNDILSGWKLGLGITSWLFFIKKFMHFKKCPKIQSVFLTKAGLENNKICSKKMSRKYLIVNSKLALRSAYDRIFWKMMNIQWASLLSFQPNFFSWMHTRLQNKCRKTIREKYCKLLWILLFV